MKCRWYAEFEGVCTNGECPYRGDTCPTSEHPEVCKHAEKKPEIPQLSVEELAKTLRLCNIISCRSCTFCKSSNCRSILMSQAADMLEKLAAEKDEKKPEWIERQRTAISAIETCRQLKKSLFGKENVTNDELVRTVLQLKSGRCEDRGGAEKEEER